MDLVQVRKVGLKKSSKNCVLQRTYHSPVREKPPRGICEKKAVRYRAKTQAIKGT